MIKKSINRSTALLARPYPMMPMRIGICKFVAAFAMGLRAFFCRVNGYCFRLRFLISAVCRLLLARSPSTIGRPITIVVVDSFQGMGWRGLRAHIGNEVSESFAGRQSPPVADGDSAAAPIFKILSVFVRASLNHIGPCGIQRVVVYAHGINNTAVITGESNGIF